MPTTMVKLRCIRSVIVVGAFCYIVFCFVHFAFLPELTKPFLPRTHPVLKHVNTTNYDTLITNNNNYYSRDIVELAQFYRIKQIDSMKFTSQVSPPVLEDYKHKVVVHCGGLVRGIDIVINELYRARRTRGGSSFRILSTSSSLRQTCSFDDYFNGTYVAFCLLDRTGCTKVTIDLMFVEYMAYTHKVHPLNKFLWMETICATKCYLTNSAKQTLWNTRPSASLQRRVELQNRMAWQQKNESLKLFVRGERNGTWQHYETIGGPHLCSCIRHKRVIMVGASHMRFKADYFFILCYSLPPTIPRKHKTISIGNINFIWLRFLADYGSLWEKHLQPLNITRRDIVYIQTGSWDLFKDGPNLDQTMGHGVELFLSSLKYIRDRLLTRGASLILVTSPPHADLSKNHNRGHRNNFALTAFNAVITSAGVNMAIPVHDEFGLILPRCEEFAYNAHYLYRKPEDNSMYGEVGLISGNMMLRSVCTN